MVDPLEQVASPAPQPTNTSPRVATSDQLAKASALLDSVVDSIQSPRAQPQVLPSLTHPEPSSSSSPIPATLEIPPAQPSPTARHRALADALFGVQDRPKTPEGPLPSFLSSSSSPLLQEEIGMVVAAPVPMQSVHAQVHVVTGTSDDDGDGDVGIAREETPMGRDQDTPKPNMLSFSMKRDVTTPSAAPVVVLNQQTQPSTPPATQTSGFISHSPSPRQMDPALLAEEVQRRAEAATAALRKSPSHPKINEVGSTRKRISPNQISSPKLMSASTSVDTIPLRPTVPTNTTTTNTTTTPATTPQKETGKLGFRLKRLRGTLRAKPHVPSAEEITPFPLDLKSGSGRSTTQSPSFSPYNSVSSSAGISMSSATDSTRSRMPGGASVGLGLGGGERGGGAQSPPTTSGPGIKGFMSRFRKHRAASDASTPPPSRSGPLGSSGLSSAGGSISSNANGAMGMEKAFVSLQPQIHSAPPMKSQFSMTTTTQARNGGAVASGGAQRPGTPQTFTPEPTIPENDVPQLLDGIVPSHTQEDEALKQLFDAATNLGLDQSAIGALLARSPSTARSTAWSRLARENSVTGNRKSVRSTARASTISQYTTQSEGRPSVDSIPPPVPRASLEVKQLNIRKNTEPLTPRARPNRNEDAANPVVRRTIVFASDSRTSGFDLGAIIRKQSTSRKRRSAGAGSLKSNRSIQDRAPTPPPPRASGGGGRRFSIDTAGSPPVPQIPGNGMLVVPSSSTMDQINPGQMEKSSSAYDSL